METLCISPYHPCVDRETVCLLTEELQIQGTQCNRGGSLTDTAFPKLCLSAIAFITWAFENG